MDLPEHFLASDAYGMESNAYSEARIEADAEYEDQKPSQKPLPQPKVTHTKPLLMPRTRKYTNRATWGRLRRLRVIITRSSSSNDNNNMG